MAKKMTRFEFVTMRLLQLLAIPCMALIIFGLYSATDATMKGKVEKVIVEIKPLDGDVFLVTKPILANILKNKYNNKFKGSEIDKLNLTEIEQLIEKNKYVKDAQVYIDARNSMHIKVIQRNPVLRVLSANEPSFFLDEDGTKIPYQKEAVMRLPVLTGNLPIYKSDLIKKSGSIYESVFELIQALQKDNFMKAFTEQVFFNEQNELCIMPKIGDQVIILGDGENINKKFKKLEIFYKKAMPKEAIELYIEELQERGEAIPDDSNTLEYSLNLETV